LRFRLAPATVIYGDLKGSGIVDLANTFPEGVKELGHREPASVPRLRPRQSLRRFKPSSDFVWPDFG